MKGTSWSRKALTTAFAAAVTVSMLTVYQLPAAAEVSAQPYPPCQYLTIASLDGIGGNTEAILMETSFNEATGDTQVWAEAFTRDVWLTSATLIGNDVGFGVELPLGTTHWEHTIPSGMLWDRVEVCGMDAPAPEVPGFVPVPQPQFYPAVATDQGEILISQRVFDDALRAQGAVDAAIYDYTTLAWLADGSGHVANSNGVTTFGDASDLPLNAPVVAVDANNQGDSYWLAAADGGVFTYGAAGFFGSLGDRAINQPIVDIAVTPNGQGYWLLGADGGVFSFGSAWFHGSAVSQVPSWDKAVAIATTLTGNGYWVVTDYGYVYAFGDASQPGTVGPWAATPCCSMIDIQASPNGWYWLLTASGKLYSYGPNGSIHDEFEVFTPTRGKVIALGRIMRQFGGRG